MNVEPGTVLFAYEDNGTELECLVGLSNELFEGVEVSYEVGVETGTV